MGFGLIFIGYITLLFFKVMPPAMAVGAYLMHRGLKKLSIYGKSFEKAAYASAVLCGYYVLYCGIWLVRFSGLGDGIFSGKVFTFCDDILYYGILLAFHIFMYAAFENMSRECGFLKGIKKAYMSRVLMAMFYVLTAINIPMYLFGVKSYMPFACTVCQFVWIIYTSVYVYSCYMNFVTDEVLAEEQKKIAEYDAKYGYKKAASGKSRKK